MSFNFLLKEISGDLYTININKNDTILHCRLKTASEVGCCIDNVKLIKNGKILDDHVTIK